MATDGSAVMKAPDVGKTVDTGKGKTGDQQKDPGKKNTTGGDDSKTKMADSTKAIFGGKSASVLVDGKTTTINGKGDLDKVFKQLKGSNGKATFTIDGRKYPIDMTSQARGQQMSFIANLATNGGDVNQALKSSKAYQAAADQRATRSMGPR